MGKPYKVLSFDLDGTIMKTDEDVVAAHRYAAEAMKVRNIPYERLDLFIGPSNEWFCKEILHMDDMAAQRYDALFREAYIQNGVVHSRPYDGLLPMLATLRGAEYRMYVCTAKSEAAAIDLADQVGFGQYFDGIYGALGVGDEKTDILARLLRGEGIDPRDCAMIGDRYTDLDGGRACGTKTVGVLYGYGPEEEIRACRPDYIARDVEDLRWHLLGDEAEENLPRRLG